MASFGHWFLSVSLLHCSQISPILTAALCQQPRASLCHQSAFLTAQQNLLIHPVVGSP